MAQKRRLQYQSKRLIRKAIKDSIKLAVNICYDSIISETRGKILLADKGELHCQKLN